MKNNKKNNYVSKDKLGNNFTHKQIVETDEVLYYYILHENSNTHSVFSKGQLDFITTTDKMCEFLKKEFKINELLCNRKKIQARLSILNKILTVNNKDKLVKELKEQIKTLYNKDKDKIYYSKKDKIAIWFAIHTKFLYKLLFSFYLQIRLKVKKLARR